MIFYQRLQKINGAKGTFENLINSISDNEDYKITIINPYLI